MICWNKAIIVILKGISTLGEGALVIYSFVLVIHWLETIDIDTVGNTGHLTSKHQACSLSCYRTFLKVSKCSSLVLLVIIHASDNV